MFLRIFKIAWKTIGFYRITSTSHVSWHVTVKVSKESTSHNTPGILWEWEGTKATWGHRLDLQWSCMSSVLITLVDPLKSNYREHGRVRSRLSLLHTHQLLYHGLQSRAKNRAKAIRIFKMQNKHWISNRAKYLNMPCSFINTRWHYHPRMYIMKVLIECATELWITRHCGLQWLRTYPLCPTNSKTVIFKQL